MVQKNKQPITEHTSKILELSKKLDQLFAEFDRNKDFYLGLKNS